MLSDALFEAETAIHHYQTEMPDIYGPVKTEIDALRCQMVVLQMRLDGLLPEGWLERHPIYVAALAGDIGPQDRFIHDGDDSVLAEFWAELKAAQDAAEKAP
ncbi:Hypothetical protein NGAL_HAMBI490_59660 [Neorhizobium galegae bv. officinalis]|nr:Hypothetical protein NGAL_HAMBI490_59660 [Neorhizobium galegae bv. officinalis]